MTAAYAAPFADAYAPYGVAGVIGREPEFGTGRPLEVERERSSTVLARKGWCDCGWRWALPRREEVSLVSSRT